MFTNLYKKSNHRKKSGAPFENEKKKNWIQCYGWKLIQSTIVKGVENCSDFQRDKRKKRAIWETRGIDRLFGA